MACIPRLDSRSRPSTRVSARSGAKLPGVALTLIVGSLMGRRQEPGAGDESVVES